MDKPLVFTSLLVGIVIGIIGYAAYEKRQSEVVATPTPIQVPNTPPPEEAAVAGIIDAITVRLDTGHIVRYIGVQTPNVKDKVECFGRETVKANESVIGKRVRLEEEPLLPRSADGAWTRYVFLQDVEEEDARDEVPATSHEGNDDFSPSPLAPRGSPLESPTPEPEDEIFINERILEGGFGYPVVAENMKYGERLLAAARYASATGKGLWSQCEVTEDENAVARFRTQEITECIIKGENVSSSHKVYRLPECAAYKDTIVVESEGGAWFCSEEDAQKAGFARAGDCN